MSESKEAMTKEKVEWTDKFITNLAAVKTIKKEAISTLHGVVERDEIQPTEESVQILEDMKRAVKTLSEETERRYGFLTDQEEELRANGNPAVIWLIDRKKEVDGLNPEIDHAIAAFETRLKRLLEETEQPETTIKALTRPLDNMPINHSFAMKVLEGFEDIPYGDGSGTFTLEAKKGTGQKTVLSATPEACRDFIANDGANWEYAARIAAVVYELIRKPEAAAMKTEGRVWVTTNTIVKELTRTARGVNAHATRDKAFRKLVMDGLKALSSAQISSYDASGNLQFMGYLLQAEYLAEAKDAAGNTIKDIWGFSVDKEALAFAVFTEKSTVNAPLLDMKPMKKSNAWIVQALRGDVLSEIRAKLYPKRGKGVKQYTAKRDWVEVFKIADVKADGDIRSSVKQRIVNDFEEQLRALAVNEKNADKLIYLEARATRDARRGKGGGAWLKLEVTGHKTFSNKYRIDLSGQ